MRNWCLTINKNENLFFLLTFEKFSFWIVLSIIAIFKNFALNYNLGCEKFLLFFFQYYAHLFNLFPLKNYIHFLTAIPNMLIHFTGNFKGICEQYSFHTLQTIDDKGKTGEVISHIYTNNSFKCYHSCILCWSTKETGTHNAQQQCL